MKLLFIELFMSCKMTSNTGASYMQLRKSLLTSIFEICMHFNRAFAYTDTLQEWKMIRIELHICWTYVM